MLAVYFGHFRKSQEEYNCSLIKVDWLAACIALRMVGAVLVVSSGVGIKFAQSSSQWEAGPIPEEMSQTLLTNKKQGIWGETRINREKYTFTL